MHFAVSHHLHFNAKCSGSFNGCGDVVETCNLEAQIKHELELGTTEAEVKQVKIQTCTDTQVDPFALTPYLPGMFFNGFS